MKRLKSLVMGAMVAVLVLSGTAQAAQVTLRYWSFLDPNDQNPRSVAQTRIIEDFTAKNPDIAVKVEVVHSSRMPMAIEAGAVISLDRFVSAWSDAQRKDFLLSMDHFLYKGKLYLLPWEHRVESILMYRKDLFDEIGIRQPPRTWPEVEEAARRLFPTSTTATRASVSPMRRLMSAWSAGERPTCRRP